MAPPSSEATQAAVGTRAGAGVREAIEGSRWTEAADYITRTAAALDAASARIDTATALLKGSV